MNSADATTRADGATVLRFQTVTMRRSDAGPPVDVPASSDSAIAAWRPFRPALTGTPTMCLPLPQVASRGSLAASFGATRETRGTVSVFTNEAGELQRYTESRGVVFSPDYPNARNDAERDSIMVEARKRTRLSQIVLDYSTGRASATNYGGELPIDAIGGTVEEFEALPHMGDIKAKAAAVLATCGK